MNRRQLFGAVALTAGLGTPARGVQPTTPAAPDGSPFEARTPDGLVLSGRAYGDPTKPEILLVHGLCMCRLCWDRQLVAGLVDRFRVVTFDLRGHGDSDKPADSAAYADGGRWADDVAAVIRASKLRRPILVGWSFGGLVVGHYLAKHGSGGVAGVNLVGAVTKQDPALVGPDTLTLAPKLGDPDLGVRTAACRDVLAACFAEPPPRDEFERMLVFYGMVPRALYKGIAPVSGGDKLDAAWAAAPRVLVTFGAKDRFVRRAMAERVLALNPRAKLSVYEAAGHSSHIEDSTRFNRELAAFAGV